MNIKPLFITFLLGTISVNAQAGGLASASGLSYFLFSILLIVAFILILRLLGAWMLRINIVIRELKTLNENILNNSNSSLAYFDGKNWNNSMEFKYNRVIEVLNSYTENELSNQAMLSELGSAFGIDDKVWKALFLNKIELLKQELRNKKTDQKTKSQEAVKNENEQIQNGFGDVAKNLKGDEMIVRMISDNSIQVIKKSDYETDKELHLVKTKYEVLFKNE